jgi:hypothetical protein
VEFQNKQKGTLLKGPVKLAEKVVLVSIELQ